MRSGGKSSDNSDGAREPPGSPGTSIGRKTAGAKMAPRQNLMGSEESICTTESADSPDLIGIPIQR